MTIFSLKVCFYGRFIKLVKNMCRLETLSSYYPLFLSMQHTSIYNIQKNWLKIRVSCPISTPVQVYALKFIYSFLTHYYTLLFIIIFVVYIPLEMIIYLCSKFWLSASVLDTCMCPYLDSTSHGCFLDAASLNQLKYMLSGFFLISSHIPWLFHFLS